MVERPLRKREVTGSKPSHAIPKALKMVPVATLLGAQYYKASTGFSHSLISSQSLNLGGRRGTTDDAATIPFHPSLSPAARRESPNPIPVHSLMLSSHLFFCLPLLLAPFTVPCRIVFAMPEDLEMWPYHLSFRFFTMVRRSSCTPIVFWILLWTSSFVTWSL